MGIIRAGSLMLATVLVYASCSDPSAQRTPVSLTLVSGGSQSARVRAELPEAVVVEVTDADGRPVRGATVTWGVARGGGSVSATTSSTDADGRTDVRWTLGSEAGENRLGAVVVDLPPLSIHAVAEAGPVASAVALEGDGQTGLEHLPLADGIVVLVRDADGNGVRNANVTFAAQSGGSVTPQSTVTDGSGMASAIWTLGAAGDHVAHVSVAGFGGMAAQFSATALAPSAITRLVSGQQVTGIAAARGQDRYFRIDLPENATHLTVSTTGPGGDADLYVRHERLPDTASSACASTTPFANESCTVERPTAGTWYVLVDAYTAYTNLSLHASHGTGGSMAIDVTGLPASVLADLLVMGPDGYSRRVTASDTLTALAAGAYSVTAAHVLANEAVFAASPETQVVDVEAGAAAQVAVAYGATSGELNLDIVNAYITQSVQRADGSVPLVAGRDGLLRIFGRGNAVSNATPVVRARLYNGGELLRTFSINAPGTVVPVRHDERYLTTTWNVVVPGDVVQPGLTLLFDIDPADEIAETNELDNVFPRSGPPLQLDVRTSAPLRARLVPVVQANGTQPDLTAMNVETYTTDAAAIYPLQRIDADVRAPYTFSATLTSSYDSTWQRLLSEINALRVAEAPERYYYGVFKPAYSSGGTGLGYLHQRAAIGVDWPNYRSFTLAHEWGHNFGRHHVDCGGPAGPDPNYPYAGGRLGHHGYDIRSNSIRELESHYDLMSYCSPTWASDYTYEAVLSFLAATGVAGMAPGGNGAGGAERAVRNAIGGTAEPALLVWGRIGPDGAVLEPSFEVVTSPSLPTARGPYRVTGTTRGGRVVLDMAFDAYEVDHLPGVRLFAYAIPLRMMGGEVPTELRLSGAGGTDVRREMAAAGGEDMSIARAGADGVRFRWNAARAPLLVIRDGRTGEILSLARGGDAQIVTTAAEVQVNVSNGVRSVTRRIAVPR